MNLKSLCVLGVLCAAGVHFAAAATLEWNLPSQPEVAGCKIYIGSESRQYDRMIDVGLSTNHVLCALEPSRVYYFALTSYDSAGNESEFSDEITYARPLDGVNALGIPVLAGRVGDTPTLQFTNTSASEYFVQASTNLLTWETLQAFTAEADCVVLWSDTNAAQFPLRFYRVIEAH